MFNKPILFLIFNRLDTTEQVFAEIRKQQPQKLYVAADGPRAHKEGEAERCQETRDFVMNHIDWDCEVHTLFRDENLGCRRAVSSAISWFFEQEEMGIVLEDDCLPDPSFFNYTSELLEKYQDDERVMMISGDNFLRGTKVNEASYYFARIPHIWGWASWRRAWQHYDVDMASFDKFKTLNVIKDLFSDPVEQAYWMTNFTKVGEQGMDTWDYQWVYTILSQNGLCATPAVNLISNIGFVAGATHTTNPNDPNANLPRGTLSEVVHPQFVLASSSAHEYSKSNVFGITPVKRSLPKRAINKILRTIHVR